MSEINLELPKSAKKRIKARLKPSKTTWIINSRFPVASGSAINRFGCSGGKDSTALLLWALFESGYNRDSLDVSFCDTGNESPITYDYLNYLEDRLQIGITRIKPERDFFELSKFKRRFLSARARFCTEYLKVIPTNDYIASLKSSTGTLTLHSGVRAAESDARSQLPPQDFDERFGCIVKRPLLKWSISDVWEMHRKHDVKPNPLYAAGMTRVGCFPCIMSRKDEIRRIAKNFPEVFDKIREAENDVNKVRDFSSATFFHSTTVPVHARTGPVFQRTTKTSNTGKTSVGTSYQIATVDDVIKWSTTARGGKQQALDFDDVVNFEKLPMGESSRSCPSSLGMCE